MKKTIALLFFITLTMSMILTAAEPYAGYVYPAGGQTGTKLTLLIGGQYFWSKMNVLISGGGIKVLSVTPVPGFAPPTWKQRTYLQKAILALSKGKPLPPLPSPEEREDWRKNIWWEKLDSLTPFQRMLVEKDLYTVRNALQETPSLRQLLIVELEIAADAKPGIRTLRLWNRSGISAPKQFFLDREKHESKDFFIPPYEEEKQQIQTDVPVILNGLIMPGKTETFRLRLKAGKRYSFKLTGRALQPYIGDAVPGFFQPVLILTDDKDGEIAYADDNGNDPDPHLRCQVGKDGVYTLSVRDNLYRGREDFVFRIEAGEEKNISTDEVPSRAGKEKKIHSAGEHHAAKGILSSGEKRIFRIKGKKNQIFVAEVFAAANGSPLDSVLKLYAPDDTLCTQNDDRVSELNIGPHPQQTDSYLRVRLPADGVYTLELTDRTGRGGRAYFYHLRFGAPSPGFRIYTERSGFVLPPGGQTVLPIRIERIDGFNGPIEVNSMDMEVRKGRFIPSGANSAQITLRNHRTYPPNRPKKITLTASAFDHGTWIVEEVIACDKYTQAFAYDHLLPAPDGLVLIPRRTK